MNRLVYFDMFGPHNFVITNIDLCHPDNRDFCWNVYVNCYPVWTAVLGFLKLGNFDPAITHLPGCFRPWTFVYSIGYNMLPLHRNYYDMIDVKGTSCPLFRSSNLVMHFGWQLDNRRGLPDDHQQNTAMLWCAYRYLHVFILLFQCCILLEIKSAAAAAATAAAAAIATATTTALLYAKFVFSLRIFYRGVLGFATDCICGAVFQPLAYCKCWLCFEIYFQTTFGF